MEGRASQEKDQISKGWAAGQFRVYSRKREWSHLVAAQQICRRDLGRQDDIMKSLECQAKERVIYSEGFGAEEHLIRAAF